MGIGTWAVAPLTLCHLGDKTISMFKFKRFAVLAMPLLLGGCGLPVGVQVASFVADGLSYLATDKTLTDHGLSLVTKQDCAIWRSLRGDDICKTGDDPYGDIMVAELPDESPQPIRKEETESPPVFSETVMEKSGVGFDIQFSTTEFAHAPLGDAFGPVNETTETSLETAIASNEKAGPEAPVEFVEVASIESEPKITEEPFQQSGTGGTYYVIASYYKAADAERFASKQTGISTQVLSGTAKGKSVYRVAVGPVADRLSAKVRLAKSGYVDAWALKQENPKVIVEIASLE